MINLRRVNLIAAIAAVVLAGVIFIVEGLIVTDSERVEAAVVDLRLALWRWVQA